MTIISIQPLGRNRDAFRLWIESQRLERLGFPPGLPLQIEQRTDQLSLRPAVLSNNHVSSRNVAGGRRPIIDLADQSLLAGLSSYSELKIIASFERIAVAPSHRAFAITRSRQLSPPLRVLELFAGGGTMTAALAGRPEFAVVAGIELNPDFADEWQHRHPDAALFQADVRALKVSEFPGFDLLLAGIPCTSHSNLGRAKHGLAGQPETGESGDLFLPVLSLVAERMPAAVVLENVPGFGSSLAGQLVVLHLQRLGYHVTTSLLKPNAEWGQPEDRQRWLLVATLNAPFSWSVPAVPNTRPVSDWLDPPDSERDRIEAARIANTIAGLRRHNARHQAAGHGFSFSVLTGEETKIPTIPRSYHKINTGPFVATPFGPRLLRQSEIERLHGVQIHTQHYATAVQILGQGVLTPIFRCIFDQLLLHLIPDSTGDVVQKAEPGHRLSLISSSSTTSPKECRNWSRTS